MFDSSTSSANVKNPEQETGKVFWKNRVQHLFFFLGYCVNMKTFSSFIMEDAMTNPDHVPSILQTVLMCAIVGGPLLFIQMFIGQFTQRGCIAIGSMVPALYGFGFCMMVVAIFDCVENLYYSGASLFYLFTSVLNFPYPSWMYCSEEMYKYFPNCFSREDIDLCQSCSGVENKPCFEPDSKIFSAKLFKLMVAFEKDKTIVDLSKIGHPQVKSVFHVFIVILFIYILSCRRLKSLDWSLRICLIICLLGVIVTSVVSLVHKNIWTALIKFGTLRLESLRDVTAWMAAFRRVTEALKISSGGHVFLGSYMMPDTPSHFRTTYLVGYYILFIILFYIYFHLHEVLLQCRLNMPNCGIYSASDIVFVMLPTELGLTATPQLWCTLHFTVYWILSTVSTVMQIIMVDETISDEFKIGEYYIYTRCVICSIIFLFCLPLTTKGGTIIARTMAHELKIINLLVITLIFIVIFLYNIQRLKDDIYFVLNTPPTWYIQTCWIVTAFIAGVLFLYQILQYQSDNRFYAVRLPMYLLIGLPFLIGFTVKLIQYLKKQNITGIFRPSVYYGAPDLNTRLMRLLYNPRLEVRYRRRKDSCMHRCLLNNKTVVGAIGNELLLLRQMVRDLSRSEEDRAEYKDIIIQLKEHYRVMHIRFEMLVGQAGSNSILYS